MVPTWIGSFMVSICIILREKPWCQCACGPPACSACVCRDASRESPLRCVTGHGSLMPLSPSVGSQARAKGSQIQEGLEEGPHQESSQPGEVSPPRDTGTPRAQCQAATVGTDFLSLPQAGGWCAGGRLPGAARVQSLAAALWAGPTSFSGQF